MSYTVVGLFDSKADAHAAMNELVQNGFVSENIDMSEGVRGNAVASTTTTTTDTGSSIGNFFNHLFDNDTATAQNYSSIAQEAEAILTVHVDSQDRANRVAEIFDRHGSIDVDDRATQFSQTTTTTQDTTATDNRTAVQGDTIPVIEEELQVGKRTVEQGGVRIRSRVIEKPVEETLRLRQERVIVERHPVNRAVTDADLTNFKEGDIEITERSEEAVVAKQARVVEEVSVGKQVEERDQVISDTVRRTDVEVEQINTTGNVTTDETTTTTTTTDDTARRANN